MSRQMVLKERLNAGFNITLLTLVARSKRNRRCYFRNGQSRIWLRIEGNVQHLQGHLRQQSQAMNRIFHLIQITCNTRYTFILQARSYIQILALSGSGCMSTGTGTMDIIQLYHVLALVLIIICCVHLKDIMHILYIMLNQSQSF